MLNSFFATIQHGKIELPQDSTLPDGTQVLVTLLPPEDEATFWTQASEAAAAKVWSNEADDVYAELRGIVESRVLVR
jgi:hypothetical protein